MNFDELALNISDEVLTDRSDKYAWDYPVLEFARRLREEWVKNLEPVAYWSEMHQCYSFDQKYCDSVPLYTLEELK